MTGLSLSLTAAPKTSSGGLAAPTPPVAPFQSSGFAQAPSGNPAGAVDGSVAYTCGDILLGWSAVAGATSYDIYEGTTFIANVVTTNYTVVGPSTIGTHTYSIYTRQGPQSSGALIIGPISATVCVPNGAILSGSGFRSYNHATKTMAPTQTNIPANSVLGSSVSFLGAFADNNPNTHNEQYGVLTISGQKYLAKQTYPTYALQLLSDALSFATGSGFVLKTPDGSKYVLFDGSAPVNVRVINSTSGVILGSYTVAANYVTTGVLGIDNNYIYSTNTPTGIVDKWNLLTGAIVTSLPTSASSTIFRKVGNKIFWWRNNVGTRELSVIDTVTMTSVLIDTYAFNYASHQGFAKKGNFIYTGKIGVGLISIDLTTNAISIVDATIGNDYALVHYEPVGDRLIILLSGGSGGRIYNFSTSTVQVLGTGVVQSIIPIGTDDFLGSNTPINASNNAVVTDGVSLLAVPASAGQSLLGYIHYKP